MNSALNESIWGGSTSPRLRYARTLLAAHFGTLAFQGAGGASGGFGAVMVESAGGLSRQYASFSPNGTDPTFDKTIYGQMYRTLLRGTTARMPIVG